MKKKIIDMYVFYQIHQKPLNDVCLSTILKNYCQKTRAGLEKGLTLNIAY